MRQREIAATGVACFVEGGERGPSALVDAGFEGGDASAGLVLGAVFRNAFGGEPHRLLLVLEVSGNQSPSVASVVPSRRCRRIVPPRSAEEILEMLIWEAVAMAPSSQIRVCATPSALANVNHEAAHLSSSSPSRARDGALLMSAVGIACGVCH